MDYEVFILRRAQKQLSGLPNQNHTRIRDLVVTLATNPRPSGCKKLIGREGWRVRSGDYRVIYEIDDDERRVTILDIGHRKASTPKTAPAFYSQHMKEFLLPYDAVRQSSSPEDALMDFLQRTYEAGANLAKWDRKTLERSSRQ